MPAFVNSDDAEIQRALDIATAKPYVDGTWLGDEARGWNLCIAHFIALEKDDAENPGGAGAVQMGANLKTVGRVTVQRSNDMMVRYEGDHFLLTKWGKQFRQLRRDVGHGAHHV